LRQPRPLVGQANERGVDAVAAEYTHYRLRLGGRGVRGDWSGLPRLRGHFVAAHVEAIGANYVSCDVAFGDMTFAEAMRTTELIGREVMPTFAE
jgi:hypothetical protein